MSEWILCKSWWPPKKGQRAKFSKLWLLGILGPFRTCGSEVNGSDDSDVRHVLGHDSCCGPDYYAFPVPRLECGMGPGSLGSLVPWSPGKKTLCLVDPLFFCFEGLMIDFSSHGEDTHFYIGTDGDLFQIAAHESCHRPIHHECSHHNIIFWGGFSFFPVQLLKFTELGFPAHPQIRIHTGIQLALVQLESIQNLGIFPRWELPQSWENHGKPWFT